MTPDLETLFDRATPQDLEPLDLPALHRRGVRRRRASRVGGGALAVVAVAAVALTTGLRPDVVPAIEPIGTPSSVLASEQVSVEADLPSDQEVAAAAALLPEPGSAPRADDLSTIAAAQEDDSPIAHLRTNDVACLYATGAGPSAGVPDGARSNRTWTAHAATIEDLAASCLDSDDIRSGQFHAPGPFSVCQGMPDPAMQAELLDDPAPGRTVAARQDLPPVTFPALSTWEGTCEAADVTRRAFTVSAAPAPEDLLHEFNELRRLEAAVRARALRECLPPRDAMAMALAVVDRLGQDWAVRSYVDTQDAPRCTELGFEPHLGVLTVWPKQTTNEAATEVVTEIATETMVR